MIYQFVVGAYDGETGNINIWCRSEENEKRMLRVTGFEPYMFVPIDEPVPVDESWITRVKDGFISMNDSPLKRITVTDPLQVRDHRDDFSEVHEADIHFVQRMMIDTGLKSCFEVEGRSSIVPYTDIKPVNRVILPHVVFLDIEVESTRRFPNIRNPVQPVIAITFWDTLYKRYFTVVVDRRYPTGTVHHKSDDWMVQCVSEPRELAAKTREYLKFIKGDVVTGWNIRFDIDYMGAWLKQLNELSLPLDGYEIFDLLDAYKKTRPYLGNRLKDVIVREGVVTQEEAVAKEFHIEHYLDVKQRDKFILYNKSDVEFCVKLDRGFTNIKTGKWVQYDLINNFWQQKNFAGLHDLASTLSHAQRHDVLWLRGAHDLNIILPSKPKRKGEAGLDYGGILFQPKPAIYPDLTVLDMSRYYPSILLSFPKETSPDVWGKIGVKVIGDLSSERDYWDAELAKHTPGTDEFRAVYPIRTVVKHFLSGAWGFFAYPGSRIYDPEKGNFVLKTAGEGLVRMRAAANKVGHPVVYGDTDSIFARAKMDEVPALIEILNNELADWADDMGVESNLFRIKEDRFARRTLFIRGEKSGVGLKKRYGQWIIREDDQPCDYVLIKGFDYVRGNTSEITRKVQKKVLDAVLREGTEGLVEYIRDEIENVRSGKYDLDDIVIPVNLSKPFGPGIKRGGEYYIGAIYNNQHIQEDIVPGDRVRFFKPKYIKGLPHTDWVSYIDKLNILMYDFEIDFDWLINRTIRSPTERILEAAAISWDNVMGIEDVDGWLV